MKPNCVELGNSEFVEIAPVYWEPSTKEAALSALVGFSLTDGNVTTRGKGIQASFYSQLPQDLETAGRFAYIAELAPAPLEPSFKKGSVPEYDAYQLYLYGDAARTLVDSGAVTGSKIEQPFRVPNWIRYGSEDVKRAFLASIWGAEGSTLAPAYSASEKKNKLPKMPVLSMFKCEGIEDDFFTDIEEMMGEFGVETTVKHNKVKGKNGRYLYVCSGHGNVKTFFDSVGYLCASDKQLKSWLWSKYLAAYDYEIRRKIGVLNQANDLITRGFTGQQAADSVRITRGTLENWRRRGVSRTGADFPHFDDWVSDRWDEKHGVLRVRVVKNEDAGVRPTYNVNVSSGDKSYLTATGINNFNSFERMSGQVYYAFDRSLHIGSYNFDPSKPLLVGQDFNVDPMCSAIMQYHRDIDEMWIIDEIYMKESNSAEVADELERRYWRHFSRKKIALYPDPAGGSRSSARGESDLMIFREKGIKHIYYRKKHPPVADRINSVNSMLKASDGKVRLKINSKCKHVIKSLERTIYIPGTREVNKKRGDEHMADAIGYPLEFLFPARRFTVSGVSV